MPVIEVAPQHVATAIQDTDDVESQNGAGTFQGLYYSLKGRGIDVNTLWVLHFDLTTGLILDATDNNNDFTADNDSIRNASGGMFNGRIVADNTNGAARTGTLNGITTGDSLTFDMWLKRTGNMTTNDRLYQIVQASDSSFHDLIATSATGIGMNIREGAAGNIATGELTTLTLNTWHHIAVTIDKTNAELKLWKDGVQVGSTEDITTENPTWDNTIDSYLLRNSAGANEADNIEMDELRLSNTVRYTTNFTPPTQAYAQFAATRPRIYTKLDLGIAGAYKFTNFRANPDPENAEGETGSIETDYFATNTDLDPNDSGDRTTIDAGLTTTFRTKVQMQAQPNTSNTRYLYLVDEFVSDGTQDAGLALTPDWVVGDVDSSDVVAPTWDTTVGIQSLAVQADGSLIGSWGTATDVDSSPAAYRVYVRVGSAPDTFGPSSPYLLCETKGTSVRIYTDASFNPLSGGDDVYVIVRAIDQASNEETNGVTLNEITGGVGVPGVDPIIASILSGCDFVSLLMAQ